MSRLRVNRLAGLIAVTGLMFSFMACGEVQIVEVQRVVTVEVGVPVQEVVVASSAPTAILTPTSEPAAVLATTPASTPTTTPTPTVYTVQAGDTLSAIADRYDIELDALIAANQIDDPNLVQIGVVLEIPNPGASPAQASQSSRVTPTATRIPARTFTPRPAATTVDCESGSARQYLASLTDNLSPANGALLTLTGLLQRGADDPARYMRDSDWRFAVALQLGIIQAFSNELLALRPPQALQQVHTHVAKGATALVAATQRAAEGLDTYQGGQLIEAGRLMKSGGNHFSMAHTALNRICR